MVKEYQNQYLKAKKRDKPAVASIVVDLIRKKGGRFLRRWDTNAAGQVLWVDIGDDRAREKTCQALREGAPELRRRKKALSSDEDDNAKPAASCTSWSKTTGTSASSPSGTLDHSTISRHHEGKADPSKTTTTTTSTLTHADDENSLLDDSEHEPLVIRPLMRLMPANKPVKPILLDQLAEADRDLYLQDFFPPCPIAQKRRAYERCTSDAATTTTSNAHIHR